MISKKHSAILCGSCVLVYLFITFHDEYPPVSGSTRFPMASRFINIPGLFKNFGKIVFLAQESKMADRNSKVIKVLIVTYMRSGSSLTGDILQQAKGSFYVYEPLHIIQKAVAFEYKMVLPDGNVRKPPFSFQKETYDALYNWFTCNITKLPNIGLMDPFLNKGIKSRMFPLCYKKLKAKSNEQKETIRMCARQLQGICTDSPFRIIKTIRIQLHDIRKLLDDLPSLKIIHLVRDPRATLSSQASLGMCSTMRGGQPGCTNLFCKRLENDVFEEERLMKKYPDRIMSVLYKDIARHPLEISKKMYDFIGAEFTPEAESYVFNITMAGNKNDCAICTTRSNSSEHIDSWKTTMKPTFIKIVNERCNYVIKRYEFDEFPIS